jgi:periplasmic protein TonB
MDFARQQRDPTKHLIGIAFVVLFHLVLIYALLTGLGRTMIEVIKKPISATIVDEIKAPPPPPPPPKKIEIPKPQPQQTYVPPPDIPVPTQQTEPVISAPTTVAPTEPHVIAPPVVEAPPAPPAPPKPAIRKGLVRIKGDPPEFPRNAQRLNIDKGTVVARLAVDEKGNVTDVTIVSADPPRHFDRAVIDALKEWKFAPDGVKYIGEVEINFKLN